MDRAQIVKKIFGVFWILSFSLLLMNCSQKEEKYRIIHIPGVYLFQADDSQSPNLLIEITEDGRIFRYYKNKNTQKIGQVDKSHEFILDQIVDFPFFNIDGAKILSGKVGMISVSGEPLHAISFQVNEATFSEENVVTYSQDQKRIELKKIDSVGSEEFNRIRENLID